MVNKMKKADNIVIQTPYVICNQKMYGDLKEICSKSVKTELIINAVESGVNPFGCTDYLNQKKAVRQTGSYVYEYVGTQALHTKTVLAGDTLSIVGSCNLDMRSVYLDTEISNNRTECRKKDFLWNPAHFNYSVSTFAIKSRNSKYY